MKLVIDDIRIRSGSNDKPIVDGSLYLAIRDACFPAPGWFDLISTVLEDWTPKLISFAKNHTETCSFCFFDGPYGILLIRVSAGEVRVTCSDGIRKVIQDEPINFPEFLVSFAKVLRNLATAFYHQGNAAQYGNLISELGRVSKELQSIAYH